MPVLDDPFALPESPPEARELQRMSVRRQREDIYQVVIDQQLIVADMHDAKLASSLALVLDLLLPEGHGRSQEALGEAVRALVDLAGARWLVAHVLEAASMLESTDISPACALAEAARRLRR